MLRKSKTKQKTHRSPNSCHGLVRGCRQQTDLVTKTERRDIYDALLCVQRGVSDFYAENQLLCKIMSSPLREVFKLG